MLMAFEAAARCGGFTTAAKELDLTQGAISRQVSALEKQLGVSLFRRIRKSIELTEVGEVYAGEIRGILVSLRNASLKVISDPQGGILNLAILPTFGMRWLMPRFPNFLESHPKITVNFTSMLSPFDFSAENLHAAIHFGLPNWAGTDSTFLMGEDLVPVASIGFIASHDTTGSNLPSLPLIHLETRPNAWRKWFHQNNLGEIGSGGMVFEQFAIATQAAVAGLGIALLPRFLIQTELERGDLKIIMDTPLQSEEGYYFIAPSHTTNHTPITAMRKWLLDQVND